MVDYKAYVTAAIGRRDYQLQDMEDRINRLWIDGKLTNEDREELLQLAADNARESLQIDVYEKLADLERRVYDLEHPTDIYEIWTPGKTTQQHEIVRYDVTGDEEYDLCQYNGGRSYTSLSIGKIEGWNMLDRELNPTHTITRDADGGYVVTPIPEPEPTPQPEPEPTPEPTESDSEAISEQEGTEVQEEASDASGAVTNLEGMTKSELIQYADDHGVHVLQSWTKAEIIAAIREAE